MPSIVLVGDKISPSKINTITSMATGTTIKFIKIEPGTMILKWT